MESVFTNRRLVFQNTQYNLGSPNPRLPNLALAKTVELPLGGIFVQPRAGSDHRDNALFAAFLAVRRPDAEFVCLQLHDEFYNATKSAIKAEALLGQSSAPMPRDTEIEAAFNTIDTPEVELLIEQQRLIGYTAIMLCEAFVLREQLQE